MAAEPKRRDRWSDVDDTCGPQDADVIAWWNLHNPYDDGFLCFGGDYAAIADHVAARPWIRSLTDFGCAWGVQQTYFPESVRYIGVDACPPHGFDTSAPDRWDNPVRIPFFREEPGKFYVARFPDEITPEMRGDAFISNMAIGYGPRGESIAAEVEGFAAFSCGYFRGPTDISVSLKSAFTIREIVRESLSCVSEPLYFYSRP